MSAKTIEAKRKKQRPLPKDRAALIREAYCVVRYNADCDSNTVFTPAQYLLWNVLTEGYGMDAPLLNWQADVYQYNSERAERVVPAAWDALYELMENDEPGFYFAYPAAVSLDVIMGCQQL